MNRQTRNTLIEKMNQIESIRDSIKEHHPNSQAINVLSHIATLDFNGYTTKDGFEKFKQIRDYEKIVETSFNLVNRYYSALQSSKKVREHEFYTRPISIAINSFYNEDTHKRLNGKSLIFDYEKYVNYLFHKFVKS